MSKSHNIVHQYYKKKFPDGLLILIKVNPIQFTGIEIMRSGSGDQQMRELQFDEAIFDDLKADNFEPCNPLEFNLYLSGLA